MLGFFTCLRSLAPILVTSRAILALHGRPPGLPYFSDDHYTGTLEVFFMAGVAAFALRDRLVIRLRYTILLAVVAAVFQGTTAQEYAL